MTSGNYNFWNFEEESISIVAGGNAEFDESDAKLLGLKSPQPVDVVAQTALERLQVLEERETILFFSPKGSAPCKESEEVEFQRKKELRKVSSDILRAQYIYETVGAASLVLWLKSLETD